ncbi:MAG TPA: aldehyde dehydrogenase family protein [Pirellulaceae bacterium]|nr:aldehyde dehydrogenase family protein [Pirellulaceae bacterium]HMO91579.1 aldehyde dehydrogenase family protein [Pirellulaceae bacterium]HMP68276.1 aldehyde dehydrogenase family protein [Pirellulaceae bacterium]
MNIKNLLQRLEIQPSNPGACIGAGAWITDAAGERLVSYSPINAAPIGDVIMATRPSYDQVVDHAISAFNQWREVPAPARGQLVRDLGNALRDDLEPLGELISLEMGKIRAEGIGEVQEMIDICDFAVGLSRQLCGSTMHSERPKHRMYEQWHPLGAIGIISAFNFPVAVWSWNAALAAVCGDTMIWKPSLLTPLVSIAVQHICNRITADHGVGGIFNLVIGGNEEIAGPMVADRRLPLISFTGSCSVGRRVSQVVGERLGRCLLELGGNNAMIIEPDANLDLAVRAILFGAIGTSGQRCTTTRRLLVHESIIDSLSNQLIAAYRQVKIGNPLDKGVIMGPVVSATAIELFEKTLKQAQIEGGEILVGGRILDGPGYYVEPTIVRMHEHSDLMHQESFVPILFLLSYRSLDEAMAMQNSVPQGLSSSIFTTNLIAAEKFLSASGSDCGIANVNIGTSGAEIGGAFGGEKDTGGGRESGSDAWKIYMRRQTNTINWSDKLPLAQGINFG